MELRRITSCWLLLLALPYSFQAQAKGGQEVSESLRGFVQEFYNWYVPRTLRDKPNSSWDLALKQKRSLFSPQLVRAIREDSAAQIKSPREIVGLDFDPFLNSQDPSERYEVGNITPRGESYWVDIYGLWPGKKRERPDVMAELLHRNGRWLFVNFHYPGDKDLLSVLKSLAENRKKVCK
jgi:hypothetical protein